MVGISNGPRPFPSERSEQGGVVWGTGQDVVVRNVIIGLWACLAFPDRSFHTLAS